jgi:hypothetical protein
MVNAFTMTLILLIGSVILIIGSSSVKQLLNHQLVSLSLLYIVISFIFTSFFLNLIISSFLSCSRPLIFSSFWLLHLLLSPFPFGIPFDCTMPTRFFLLSAHVCTPASTLNPLLSTPAIPHNLPDANASTHPPSCVPDHVHVAICEVPLPFLTTRPPCTLHLASSPSSSSMCCCRLVCIRYIVLPCSVPPSTCP